MPEKINLKELERRVYLSYHRDGLLDICMGTAILLFGIFIAAYHAYLGVVTAIALIFAYQQLKKFITVPRIGYVKFSVRRKKRMTANIAVLMVLLIAFIITSVIILVALIINIIAVETLIIPVNDQIVALIDFLSEYSMTIIGLTGAVIIAFEAFMLGVNRIYAYAMLWLAVFVAGQFLGEQLHLFLILFGLVVLLAGMVILYRFLQKFPIENGK